MDSRRASALAHMDANFFAKVIFELGRMRGAAPERSLCFRILENANVRPLELLNLARSISLLLQGLNVSQPIFQSEDKNLYEDCLNRVMHGRN